MLANVIRKELEQIFCQFDSKLEAADEVRTGFSKCLSQSSTPDHLQVAFLIGIGQPPLPSSFVFLLLGARIYSFYSGDPVLVSGRDNVGESFPIFLQLGSKSKKKSHL